MTIGRTMSLAIVAASAFALAGCTSYGNGRGYGGVSIGTAGGYYDRGYYGDGYYGDPYYGWYGDYYYPGAGYYVYNRAGQRYAWTGAQQRYWQARRAAWRGQYDARENWSGYRDQRRDDWRDQRRGYRDQRGDYRDQGEGYRERRGDRREDYRERRRERPDQGEGARWDRSSAPARVQGEAIGPRQGRSIDAQPTRSSNRDRRDVQPRTQPQ